jgi:hypothetical protein
MSCAFAVNGSKAMNSNVTNVIFFVIVFLLELFALCFR